MILVILTYWLILSISATAAFCWLRKTDRLRFDPIERREFQRMVKGVRS